MRRALPPRADYPHRCVGIGICRLIAAASILSSSTERRLPTCATRRALRQASSSALVLLCGILKRVGDPFGARRQKGLCRCRLWDRSARLHPCHGIVENGKRLLEERIVCQALENSAAGDALFHVKLCDAAVGKIGLYRLVWPRSGLYNGGEVVSSAYQAGSPVAMRLSMSRKAFSIASLWYISYMS